MRIFGCDRSEWQAALLEEIDSDQLPAYYGGSMTDPDGNPMCLTKVNDIIYISNKKNCTRFLIFIDFEYDLGWRSSNILLPE